MSEICALGRLLNNLLRRKIKSGQRSIVLLHVARCYLKVGVWYMSKKQI